MLSSLRIHLYFLFFFSLHSESPVLLHTTLSASDVMNLYLMITPSKGMANKYAETESAKALELRWRLLVVSANNGY